MNFDTKVRIVVLAASATVPLLAAILAVHGFVISPLGDPTGGGPH